MQRKWTRIEEAGARMFARRVNEAMAGIETCYVANIAIEPQERHMAPFRCQTSNDPAPKRLSDEDWIRVSRFFPAGRSGPGRPREDARNILDAVLWACFDDHKWSRLPSSFPAQQTCYTHFLKWRRTGVLTDVAEELELPYDALCALPPPDAK